MSIIDTLITDRTQADLINDTPKAYIDYVDLNRIETAVEYLSNILNNYAYGNKVDVKTDWVQSDFRKQEDCDRIKANYNIIKNAYYNFGNTPNFDWETIEEANRIEQILVDIGKLIHNMENYFVYCGVSNCGQNHMWQQRFRKPKTWIAQPYKLSQYYNADKLSMIATATDEQVETTEKLHLALFDKRNSVYSSIEAINDSMNIIDELVGGSEGN